MAWGFKMYTSNEILDNSLVCLVVVVVCSVLWCRVTWVCAVLTPPRVSAVVPALRDTPVPRFRASASPTPPTTNRSAPVNTNTVRLTLNCCNFYWQSTNTTLITKHVLSLCSSVGISISLLTFLVLPRCARISMSVKAPTTEVVWRTPSAWTPLWV